MVGAFTGLFSLEKRRVIPRAKVSALLRDPLGVSQLLEAAWNSRRTRHSTLWGAWDGWKKDAVKILLEQEQYYLNSLPPSPLVNSTAKIAEIIEQFGMEGSLGEEWDLLIEQFKADLAQSAGKKASSKKEWLKTNWNRPTKAFFSAIRPPPQ